MEKDTGKKQEKHLLKFKKWTILPLLVLALIPSACSDSNPTFIIPTITDLPTIPTATAKAIIPTQPPTNIPSTPTAITAQPKIEMGPNGIIYEVVCGQDGLPVCLEPMTQYLNKAILPDQYKSLVEDQNAKPIEACNTSQGGISLKAYNGSFTTYDRIPYLGHQVDLGSLKNQYQNQLNSNLKPDGTSTTPKYKWNVLAQTKEQQQNGSVMVQIEYGIGATGDANVAAHYWEVPSSLGQPCIEPTENQ